jgi:sec-independent protein translocase protein TatA
MGLDNPVHIAFLLILLLLVFGAKRLPEMGRSLGTGMRAFRQSLSGESTEPSPSAPEQRSATLALSAAAGPGGAGASEQAQREDEAHFAKQAPNGGAHS